MGYRGTSDVALALERGEIDMTATSNVDLVCRLTKNGKFKAVTQTGAWVNNPRWCPSLQLIRVALLRDLVPQVPRRSDTFGRR